MHSCASLCFWWCSQRRLYREEKSKIFIVIMQAEQHFACINNMDIQGKTCLKKINKCRTLEKIFTKSIGHKILTTFGFLTFSDQNWPASYYWTGGGVIFLCACVILSCKFFYEWLYVLSCSYVLNGAADRWSQWSIQRNKRKASHGRQHATEGQKQSGLCGHWHSTLVPLYFFGLAGERLTAYFSWFEFGSWPLAHALSWACLHCLQWTKHCIDSSHIFLLMCSTTWRRSAHSSPSLCFWPRVFVCNMTAWSRANSSTPYSSSVACAPCCRSPLASGQNARAAQFFQPRMIFLRGTTKTQSLENMGFWF